ncbi:MAG: hypothetical protein H5U40_03815, partial [Polyangiaceae bacterium]|nr:hypothetical protein [Polyangiaceae bacterium]
MTACYALRRMSRAHTPRGLLTLALLGVIASAAPAAAQDGETGASLSAPRADERMIAVVDTATLGVDPIVGEHVTTRIQLTSQAMGYLLAPSDEVREIRVRLHASVPASAADLWRIGYLSRADRVIAARVFADRGRYVVEVMVASLDGTGPFRAMATAGADDLHRVVAELVQQVLPPPSRWDAATAATLREQATSGAPAVASSRPAAPAPPSRDPGRRLDVAVQTESAIG